MQGFLPEAADNFAVNYVYPAFSPTLGVFLLISVIYGLIKVHFLLNFLSLVSTCIFISASISWVSVLKVKSVVQTRQSGT